MALEVSRQLLSAADLFRFVMTAAEGRPGEPSTAAPPRTASHFSCHFLAPSSLDKNNLRDLYFPLLSSRLMKCFQAAFLVCILLPKDYFLFHLFNNSVCSASIMYGKYSAVLPSPSLWPDGVFPGGGYSLCAAPFSGFYSLLS